MSKLDELLAFDPLATAEKITGVSYKDKAFGDGFDNPATALGFLMARDNAASKNAMLQELGDTTLINKLTRYREIIEKYGFEEVFAEPFLSPWPDDNGNGQWETLFVFAHRKGLLLAFDTYGGDGVNGGKVYYNWRPSIAERCRWPTISSGHLCEDGTWIGDHDCREALIHNLRNMENRGEFVVPWVERPFLWLLNFADTKVDGYDHRKLTAARLSRLPQWVQDFIGVDS